MSQTSHLQEGSPTSIGLLFLHSCLNLCLWSLKSEGLDSRRWTTAQQQDMPRHRRRPHSGHAPSLPVEKIDLLPPKSGSWTRRRSASRSWGLKRLRIGMKRCSTNFSRPCRYSERAKLTTFCIAPITTLPRTSFPDNNFASCLLCKSEGCSWRCFLHGTRRKSVPHQRRTIWKRRISECRKRAKWHKALFGTSCLYSMTTPS